jgi:very-short-patch-repair endonuclease
MALEQEHLTTLSADKTRPGTITARHRTKLDKQKISEGVKAYIKEHGPYRTNSKPTEETRRKISIALLKYFENNTQARQILSINNGAHRSEVRRKMSNSCKKRRDRPLEKFKFKKGHQLPEYIELRRIMNVTKALRKRPTSLERNMMTIIQKYNLPFRYVGDGQFWLSHCNPDFFCTDRNQKICVEVSNRFNRTHESYAQPRIERFRRLGWTCIVFFGDKNQLNEDEVMNTLSAYRGLGYISRLGVNVNLPKSRTLGSIDRNTMITREATGLQPSR